MSSKKTYPQEYYTEKSGYVKSTTTTYKSMYIKYIQFKKAYMHNASNALITYKKNIKLKHYYSV